MHIGRMELELLLTLDLLLRGHWEKEDAAVMMMK